MKFSTSLEKCHINGIGTLADRSNQVSVFLDYEEKEAEDDY